MSGCAIRRWGTGSGYTKECNSAACKEMESKMKDMVAERNRQDMLLWGSTEQAQQQPQQQTQSKKPQTK